MQDIFRKKEIGREKGKEGKLDRKRERVIGREV